MESVFGTLFSVILLHENVTMRMIGGCVLILAAVILSNYSGEKKEELEKTEPKKENVGV